MGVFSNTETDKTCQAGVQRRVELQFLFDDGDQAGRRPALVLSPKAYNERVGLALVCPITNQANGYPFEVEIPAGLEVSGVVLADQVKSLDWVARRAAFIDTVPATIVMRTLELARTLS